MDEPICQQKEKKKRKLVLSDDSDYLDCGEDNVDEYDTLSLAA